MPSARAYRLVGPAAAHASGQLRPPSGATFREDAEAYAVALGPDDAAGVATVASALPAPEDLASGTLVVVLPTVTVPATLATRLFAALGRTRTIPRAYRCSALLARGYVRIGAGVDDASRLDLAWGYVY